MKLFHIVLIIILVGILSLTLLFLMSGNTESPAVSPVPGSSSQVSTDTNFDSIMPVVDGDDHVQGLLSIAERNTDVHKHIPRSGTSAYDQFISLMADDRFTLFTCELPNGSSSIGLMLVEAPSDALVAPEISPILRVANQWEPFMLQDIGQLLFPEVTGTENSLLTNFTEYELLPFVNGRMSTFQVDGVEYELHYAWNLSYIFFASSRECLSLMAEAVYSPYTH